MKLNERFLILTKCGLVHVYGYSYNNELAVIYNWKNGKYSLTDKRTGLSINEYNEVNEIEIKESDLLKYYNFINTKYGKERIEKGIDQYNYLLEHKVFADEF